MAAKHDPVKRSADGEILLHNNLPPTHFFSTTAPTPNTFQSGNCWGLQNCPPNAFPAITACFFEHPANTAPSNLPFIYRMSLEAQDSSLGFDVLTWIEENKQLLKVGLGVVIVGVTAAIIWHNHSVSTEEAASHAVVSAGSLPPGSTNSVPADVWNKLASQHSGTEAGRRALFLAASQLFQDGKYVEAEAKFDGFISFGGKDSLVASAAYGKAMSLEAQNKLPEALAAFQNVITSFRDEPVSEMARLGKARTHESSKQFDQALAIYDEFTKATNPSQNARKASELRDMLLSKHPELSRPATLTNSVNVVAPAAAK